MAFAQHLLCNSPGPEGACDECSSCKLAQGLIHPDLHFVFPVAKFEDKILCDDYLAEFRKTFLEEPYMTLDYWASQINIENKQPFISVGEANTILRKLSYTSFLGAYRIMIIWQPEKMNVDAANKLLKILEEPPEKTVFILVSEAPDQLLITIRSRVQLVPFVPNSEEEIAEGLMKSFGMPRELAMQKAILADGSFWTALISASGEDEETFLTHFQEFMRLALRFDCAKALSWVETNAALGRERHKQFLQYGLEIFRDALMYNFGDRSLVRLAGPEKSFLEKFAPFINQHNYENLVEEFNTNYNYVMRNANPKILFFDLLLRVNELINRK
jgi:DNA polymerase-3 subunit delta'